MGLPDVGITALNFEVLSTPTCSRQNSLHIPQKASLETSIHLPSSHNTDLQAPEENVFDNVDLHTRSLESVSSRGGHVWDPLENIAALGLSFNGDSSDPSDKTQKLERFSLEDADEIENKSSKLNRSFNKWARSLEQRGTRRRKTLSCDVSIPSAAGDLFESPGTQRRSAHKKSSSSSSFGFVTTVKSASISLASFSVAKKTIVSSRQQRTDRSSKTSNIGRTSEDSSYVAKGIIVDQAVISRLVQRRKVLEELINTEESYVADVKFLMNVYVTLLASMPSLSLNLRASINRNLNEILELHEELLGDLHRVVPHSEYTQSNCTASSMQKHSGGHQRWRSLDAVPENSGDMSWLQKIPGMTAEPKVAAEVARVFGKKMNRLFIYEEYGAKYEMMIKDVSSTYRTIPQWEVFQKGLEALALSLASINSQKGCAKKAMTIGDLLVKTPVCDCPDSHMEIETVLMRLREATTEINRAADDPRMKALMEKSWLLQDRISFPDMNGVDGKYLICLLYRDYVLLASSPKLDQAYNVQACIGLSDLGIEEVDNSRGLQCHTVQFSWKLVFESDHQLYELTMSACSPKEEFEWRSRFTTRSRKDGFHPQEPILYSSISLPVKPLGTVFGKPGTIARRISVHRATTVGPIFGLCQVIIKNTNAFNETPSPPINRSQSLLTTNRIPVLAPSRAERTRLEALLADVWTRDILPYPGMAHRVRSEHIVRASASSMIRKLSVASITSNFTKRSGSAAALQKKTEDDEPVKSDDSKSLSPVACTTAKSFEPQDSMWSRLFIIQDEKENMPHKDSLENLRAVIFGQNNSPTSSIGQRTLKLKKSWAFDCHRIITPPIRTSSANSINRHKLLALPISVSVESPMVTDTVEDTRNSVIQPWETDQPFQKKCKNKVNRKGRSGIPEGIRNLFR